MTNIRITDESVTEWEFCPYCGDKLERDQDEVLVRDDNGINVEASEEAGFDFDHSLSHCGFHIRLWVSDDGEGRIE